MFGRGEAESDVAGQAPVIYGRKMLAKVQYPGPEGETKQFDAEVPQPPPTRHIFISPDDGREINAILVHSDDVIAIYRAVGD